MKLYICRDHAICWPIGGTSIIVAKDKHQARTMLDEQLVAHNLKPYNQQPYTLIEVSLDLERVVVFNEGEY